MNLILIFIFIIAILIYLINEYNLINNICVNILNLDDQDNNINKEIKDYQINPDNNGYLLTGLIIGRFGNQMASLLNALVYAKTLNRILVLPAFIYSDLNDKSNKKYNMIPIEEVLDIDKMKEYNNGRIITLKEFQTIVNNDIGPSANLKMTCKSDNCLKELYDSEPSTSWWKYTGFNFIDTYQMPTTMNIFNTKHIKYLILSSLGNQSTQIRPDLYYIQQYLSFNQHIKDLTSLLLKKSEIDVNKSYLTVHYRQAKEWEHACLDAVKRRGGFFASYQCMDQPNYPRTHQITKEMCIPNQDYVIDEINYILHLHNDIKYVIINMDEDDSKLQKYIYVIQSRLIRSNVKVIAINKDDISSNKSFLIDAYMMQQSPYFGNCASSFTAIIKRMRTYEPNYYDTISYYFGLVRSEEQVKMDEKKKINKSQ